MISKPMIKTSINSVVVFGCVTVLPVPEQLPVCCKIYTPESVIKMIEH